MKRFMDLHPYVQSICRDKSPTYIFESRLESSRPDTEMAQVWPDCSSLLYLLEVRNRHYDSYTGKKKPSGYTENPATLTGRSIGAFTTLD